MNNAHMEFLTSDTWREMLRDQVFPFAFATRSLASLGDDVLEIGSGPGLTTDILAAELKQLTALELDPLLADRLRDRLQDADGVTVVEADATALPFESERFSAVVCFTMLHHVPDDSGQDKIFSEVYRVLRPGGLFVASDSVARDELAAAHADDVYHPIDPGRLRGRLNFAGFGDVDIDSDERKWRSHAIRRRN